ncbi:hypothetical protein GPECTOR_59g680 [Gonium pectorale]|uniref:SET domain-containing protein n=1 Tax=Gonium pectorale TaxID=33097 RepID=A0A150G5G9_GONPE|nr:hypothetical protein GPECTOR_59g680 [Gonium pectorale]|eukprot:KXZ45071.1 hypothetical protein GPECTOR_59g680 [Gonium pectorale]
MSSDPAGGFLVPVEVRPCIDDPAKGHGVFSLAPVTADTIVWRPGLAFVTAEDPGSLCVNPTDLGRFVNHSGSPNLGAGLSGGTATRAIAAGEELTCDYRALACPDWYQALCQQYGVLSTGDVAARCP